MKGFSLIEFIIYIGIVAVILLVAFNFGWEIIYGNIKSQAIREVQQNARFSMEKITRVIKEAKVVNSPTSGNSANSLSLEMTDPDLDPTVLGVSGNKVQITQGTFGPYELTNDRVSVSNLQFTNLSYENTPGTVRIEMTIDSVNPTGRQEYEVSFGLKSTASLVIGGGGAIEEGYCQGTPTVCSSFNDQTSCSNQDGCSWSLGSCGGTCISCKELGFLDCLSQDGCRWRLSSLKCTGNCTSCDNYNDQSSCEGQLGCSWTSPYCSGIATLCQGYNSETTCTSQDGCQWIIP